MSASLVGSEMCIRDRPTTRRRAPARRRSGSASRSVATSGVFARSSPSSRCLLYTSDAADDM
eukprot:15150594-Alexandrium_andersonii.AAC.1